MRNVKEIGKELNALPRACRAVTVQLYQGGMELKEILEKLEQFIRLEESLCSRWYQKMLNDIRELRTDPETYAYQITGRLAEKDISPAVAVKLANRKLACLKKKGHRPSRALELIKKSAVLYECRCREFYQYACVYIKVFDYDGLVKRVGQHSAVIKRLEEEKLFQLQVLHHLRNKQDDCMNPILPEKERRFPEDLLQRALSTSVDFDEKIFHEQVLLVDGFFTLEGNMTFKLENPLLVKQYCLEFIKEVLCNRIPSVILILVSFKGNWVSKEIYDIFMSSFDNLHKYGMDVVVYDRVKRVYDLMKLASKPEKKLLPTEQWVAELEAKYRL